MATPKRSAQYESEPVLPRIVSTHPRFPAIEGVRVRPQRNPQRSHGFGGFSMFKSLKNGGAYIHCTSRPELCLAYFCEFDPDVAWFCEQAITMVYRLEGRARHYTPDVVAIKEGSLIAIEAKTAAGARDEKWTRREPYIRAAFEKLLIGFHLVTTDELYVEPRLSNVRRLLEYRLRSVPDCAENVRAYVGLHGPQRCGKLCRALAVREFDIRVIIAHGLLTADVGVSFDEQVLVSC